jgi:hypothetical protein
VEAVATYFNVLSHYTTNTGENHDKTMDSQFLVEIQPTVLLNMKKEL